MTKRNEGSDSCCLCKKTDPPFTTDIYQYRLLLMLSAANLFGAQARLSALKPWITGWDMDEICAGVPAQGAAHVWYRVALEQEHTGQQGQESAAATATATVALVAIFCGQSCKWSADHVRELSVYLVA